MNKFLIPAALIATVVIAGIFAFMPVEKASTVHGTLATTAGQTTNTNTITTNTDNEVDAQNRAIDFYYNMSHLTGSKTSNIWRSNATIILGQAGITYTGYASLTAIPNNATSGVGGATQHKINCGLQTTGQDGTINSLGLNATQGIANFTRFSAVNGLTSGEGIAVILANGSGLYHGGVCAGTIVLTNWPH